VERFMASHYYPIQELSTRPPDPEIRLLEYSTVSAPNPYSFRGADIATDLVYGSNIWLAGITLPSGTNYRPGDVLPISFYWTADSELDKDYTIAWFLVSEDASRIVQGADTQPYWGFARTAEWTPSVPVWDNRAMRLPTDLAAGSYELWMRLYQSDAPENVLPVNGSQVQDGNIGILPIRIDIVP
jgi:hypothetical protein